MPDWLYQPLTSDIIAAYYTVFHTIKQREAYSAVGLLLNFGGAQPELRRSENRQRSSG